MGYLFTFSFIINLVFGGIGYMYYNDTQSKMQVQAQQIATQQVALDEQDRTITALQESAERTAQAMQEMSTRNAEIEAEKNRYLAIFSKHDLTKLANAKPGMIATRFNKGTADVFKSIEEDTAIIDSTDDN